jgi:hypothetical protein
MGGKETKVKQEILVMWEGKGRDRGRRGYKKVYP